VVPHGVAGAARRRAVGRALAHASALLHVNDMKRYENSTVR
jgi:hypothetical protein